MSDAPAAPAAPEESSGLRLSTGDGGSVPMSDVLAEPAAAEPQAAEPVAAEPAAPATEPQQPPPGHVPVQALHEERSKRRTLEQTYAPIAQALSAHPDVVAELERRSRGEAPRPFTTQPAPPQTPTTPAAEYPVELLEETAKDFGFYKADGSGGYDYDAAARTLKRMDVIAEQRAERLVKPLQERAQTETISTARAQMAAEATTAGVNPQLADALFSEIVKVDPKLATEKSARDVVSMVAESLQRRFQIPAPGQPAAAPVAPAAVPAPVATQTVQVPGGANFRAPVMTEQGTGRAPAPTVVSRFTERAGKIAGVDITPAAMDRAEKALSRMGPTGFAFSRNEND